MKIISPPSWSTTLLVDAMYYHAAQENYKAAKMALKDIEKADRRFTRLKAKEEHVLDIHDGDSFSAYDELELINIKMESAEYSIVAAYGPHLQCLALTHILCASAAEAHINQIAKEILTGKFRDQFEKVSLEGKWLFLPKMTGRYCFDQGAEPFQSFSMLIKYRNELVHYKGKKENWGGFEQGRPKFLDKLGLSLSEAHRSIQTVKIMILELSKMTQKEPPYWLRKSYHKLPSDIVTNFFNIKIEYPKESKPKPPKKDAAKSHHAP
jgi:hypothetical protein